MNTSLFVRVKTEGRQQKLNKYATKRTDHWKKCVDIVAQ